MLHCVEYVLLLLLVVLLLLLVVVVLVQLLLLLLLVVVVVLVLLLLLLLLLLLPCTTLYNRLWLLVFWLQLLQKFLLLTPRTHTGESGAGERHSRHRFQVLPPGPLLGAARRRLGPRRGHRYVDFLT